MSHFDYVFAAYGISFVILGAIIGWIMLDARSQKKALVALEAQGIRRRSDQGKGQ